MWVWATQHGVPLGEAVPQELFSLVMLVVGFWFGSKAQFAGQKSGERVAMAVAESAKAVTEASRPVALKDRLEVVVDTCEHKG